MLSIYGDERVWQWLGANPQPLRDPEVAYGRIKRWASLFDGPLGIWAVVPQGDSGVAAEQPPAPVGSVLLLHLQDGEGNYTPEVEVGWHFAPNVWGRGYATEATAALIERAWTFDIDELHAVVYPGNERSVAVTQRLGMSDVGLTDRWYGATLRHFLLRRPQ